MASEEDAGSMTTTRLGFALVFLLSVLFSFCALTPLVPLMLLTLAYGQAHALTIYYDSSYQVSLGLIFTAVFLLAFYELGKWFDFRSQYLQLAILSFAGALVGALPQLITVVPESLGSDIPSFSLESLGPATIVLLVWSAAGASLISIAGFALAFFSSGGSATADSSTEGEKGGLTWPRALLIGFLMLLMANVAYALTDVLGSRLPTNSADQFASLRVVFAGFSPYNTYAFDIFYPLLFLISFYFLGRRLDTGERGITALAISLFVAGFLGSLLGGPLADYIRAVAGPRVPASTGGPLVGFQMPSLAFAFGSQSLEDSVPPGLSLFFAGFAAASLGLVRNLSSPANRDGKTAAAVIAVALTLFTVSVFLGT